MQSENFKLMHKPILIVDDEPINFKLLETILKKSDYEALYANNGEQAIKMSGDNDFGAIIMDLKMPGLDGFETAKRIKQIKPNSKIIASSAKNNLEDYMRGTFVDFIAKPINRNKFIEMISMYSND